MELGFSRKSIELLEKEFELQKEISDLKAFLEIGIELGRALNHSGQVERTLDLYALLLENEKDIADPYILARIYEQKANVLNKIMYEKLQYGFIEKEQLAADIFIEVQSLFNEAIELYDKSMQLLLKINAVFTYSGVVPEKINTYISYSYSVDPVGIEKCTYMINEMDDLFKDIITPFKTDFYLSKAYYFEYKGDIEKAENCINQALDNAISLNIKNKEAKCHDFYSKFIYRLLLNDGNSKSRNVRIGQGLKHLNEATDYYIKHTFSEKNIYMSSCVELEQKYEKFKK